MTSVPKSMFAVVRVGLIAVVLTACGLSTQYPIPSGFHDNADSRLGAATSRCSGPSSPITGAPADLTVTSFNRYGEYAADVRFLVQALDRLRRRSRSAHRVGPETEWAFSGRAYFEQSVICPASDHYQVFVWDYRQHSSSAGLDAVTSSTSSMRRAQRGRGPVHRERIPTLVGGSPGEYGSEQERGDHDIGQVHHVADPEDQRPTLQMT